ncbi:HupE/UreJ family protein [Shimia gijangensis]|nr:HupE/UreJ family protein [Shimia gijangensis]
MLAGSAHSHALEPGYLEIIPAENDQWQVTWRKPQVSGKAMEIDAVLPAGCAPRRGGTPRFDGRAYVSGWITVCETPIWEGDIFIEKLQSTATDVLVRFVSEPGAPATTLRLTPDAPSARLPAAQTSWSVLTSYIALGVDHILAGIDHLLFVFALLLLVPDRRNLIWAITAFTVSHSMTLALATTGWISLPMPPVEAVIALSIAFLAVEVVTKNANRKTMMQRSPWLVAFAFGLLHGLGFASALQDIGLPHSEIPLALLAFNIGIETGQLMFVACLLIVAFILGKTGATRAISETKVGGVGLTVAGYAIGSVAAFWTVERTVAFFG